MKTTHATSAEDYKLCSSFEAVRKTLQDKRFADRLDKPLAYWTLPNDRRLPLAFLGKSVGELVATPFSELTSTRGVGQKKLSSLVRLLQRATSNEPPAVPFGLDGISETSVSARRPSEGSQDDTSNDDTRFDPALVSEILWDKWRAKLIEHGIGDELLGRLAPSLRSVPTVIWHAPISDYLGQSLAEIRSLRTHGEKRVTVVLQVVHSVFETIDNAERIPHLAVRVIPKFVPLVEQWLARMENRAGSVTASELLSGLVKPLLHQILVDCGENVHRLARNRLGVDGPPRSVRTQSEEMGVTRARVYQLLDECAQVMLVRWPEGRGRMLEFERTLKNSDAPSATQKLMAATRDLFFPEKINGRHSTNGNGHADKPVEAS